MNMRTIRRWLRPWIAHMERRRLHAVDPLLRDLHHELERRRRAHQPTRAVLVDLRRAMSERLRAEVAR